MQEESHEENSFLFVEWFSSLGSSLNLGSTLKIWAVS